MKHIFSNQLKAIFIVVLVISFSFAIQAQSTVIRVACIGNSITAGSGLTNPSTDAYPSVLGRILGAGYEVKNFGVSGTTMLRKGNAPYWATTNYQSAKAYKPDIVIIKLGTNDSKDSNLPFINEFETDMSNMVDTFRLLTSNPKVYLSIPAPVYGAGGYGITDAMELQEIIPRINNVVAAKSTELINFRIPLLDHPELFPDNVHPNAEGARIMAGTAYKSLTGLEFVFPSILPKDIYLSSTGSDSNDGLTSATPVATFSKAYGLSWATTGDVIHVSGMIDMSIEPGLTMVSTVKAGYLINKSISIQGSSSKTDGFDGKNLTRIFQLTGSACTHSLKNLTLKNGKYMATGTNAGGALYIGGSNVSCENVIFDSNSVFDAASSAGAIAINQTTGINFKNCVFSNNNGSGGGAIRVYDVATTDAIIRIEGCSFVNNTSSGAGGAALWLRMKGATAHNKVQFINSTFSNNNSSLGTIYLYSITDPAATVELTNCTVTANKAPAAGCTGIYVFFEFMGVLKINNSIIEGNFGGANGVLPYNDLNYETALVTLTSSTLMIHNSFIGRNTGKVVPAECYAGDNHFNYLTTTSISDNLIAGLGTYSTVRNCYPLLTTSPAIDYGVSSYLTDLSVTTDQLGTPRLFANGKCYAGAVESIEGNLPSAVSAIVMSDKLKVYQTSNSSIKVEFEETGNATIQLVSMLGQNLQTIHVGNVDAGNNSEILLHKINKGSYIVKATIGNHSYTQKIIVR